MKQFNKEPSHAQTRTDQVVFRILLKTAIPSDNEENLKLDYDMFVSSLSSFMRPELIDDSLLTCNCCFVLNLK